MSKGLEQMKVQVRGKQAIYIVLCVLLSQILAGQPAGWIGEAWASDPSSSIQHRVSSIEKGDQDYSVGAGLKPARTLDSSKPSPIVRLLRSDEEAIVLEFSVADFQSQEQWIDNRRFHLLSLPEAGYTSLVGHPQLPVKGALVAVPPGAEARLTILESSDVLLSGYHIPPVPEPIIEQAGSMLYTDPMDDEPHFVQYEYKKDMRIYASNSFYPDKPADISFSGILRG
jgi:hypothetical protein